MVFYDLHYCVLRLFILNYSLKCAFGQYQEMATQGRTQYQLLQERTNLPHYGNCWKSAVDHVEEGCRSLSEETQSSIALHLANCFLEMSGHESYNCELEKKPNLKQICLSSMSDRAFNVYTEFYTHTQNICWFLRGQVWQEVMAENTVRFGRQLEVSAQNQEDILRAQRNSVELQEKLLHHGHALEKIMEEFYVSTQQHHHILSLMASNMKSLQSWLIGEFSWIDTIIFYVASSIFIIVITSTNRTSSARFPLWLLLILSVICERLIYLHVVHSYDKQVQEVHLAIAGYVEWVRKTFGVIALCVLLLSAFYYRNLNSLNNQLLHNIHEQQQVIMRQIVDLKMNREDDGLLIVQERSSKSPFTQSFASTPSVHVSKIYQDSPVTRSRYNLRGRSKVLDP
ncbi:hypothetical protein PPYR_13623 [Photinus pyralis]|uniref:Protein GAMETE EXPRESSED 1 n=2 Tax=Photinus pyralis TaxID=7054 RepID=A0A5N4A9L2_PHOPY|nr:uncharacterized protein LOC116178903 [Photinus pyralis]KAB0794003.1 hypothetical protein PPYR_13623 [Photinus pyralis]